MSQQPLIRKHSYLDHRYPGGSAFIPWLLTPGSTPQNLGHLSKVFFYFSVMETTYADSWSDMAQPCDMDLWVMKWRSAWPIFHGPVILPYILKTIWCMYIILRSMKQYGLAFDLKINVGHCDLYFMVQWLCLIPWRLFHVWTSLFGIMNQYDLTHDLKINVGHHDLYFMVQ